MLKGIKRTDGNEPLSEYKWKSEIYRLLSWLQDKDWTTRAFCFDLVMSLAYMEALESYSESLEQCKKIDGNYNSHVSFINLCSPCYFATDQKCFQYQKAAKPKSGLLGKLSSGIILYFVEELYSEIKWARYIGGKDNVDAILKHKSGMTILAEIKSSPLLTYPFVFNIPESCLKGEHKKTEISHTQFTNAESGVYIHNLGVIDLGRVGGELWPFKPAVDFIVNTANFDFIKQCVTLWESARISYIHKTDIDKTFYITNACGSPPKKYLNHSLWPRNQSISDSKTSAGMDRTDDIKKGIYQTLKIGTLFADNPNIKTAIISNLPAYRHRHEYVSPFENMVWSTDEHLQEIEGARVIYEENLRRVFDYIITLDEPTLRNIEF